MILPLYMPLVRSHLEHNIHTVRAGAHDTQGKAEREMGLVNPKKRRQRGNTLLLSSGEYRENKGRLLERCMTIGQAVTNSHRTREILSTSTEKKKKSSLKGLSNTGAHTYGTYGAHRSGIPIPWNTQNPTGHCPGHCNVVVPSLNMCGELYDIPV